MRPKQQVQGQHRFGLPRFQSDKGGAEQDGPRPEEQGEVRRDTGPAGANRDGVAQSPGQQLPGLARRDRAAFRSDPAWKRGVLRCRNLCADAACVVVSVDYHGHPNTRSRKNWTTACTPRDLRRLMLRNCVLTPRGLPSPATARGNMAVTALRIRNKRGPGTGKTKAALHGPGRSNARLVGELRPTPCCRFTLLESMIFGKGVSAPLGRLILHRVGEASHQPDKINNILFRPSFKDQASHPGRRGRRCRSALTVPPSPRAETAPC